MSGLKEYRERAADLAERMTISEKAELISGFSMWETREIERLNLKKADMADGPHGIRKQLDYYDIAVDESVETVGYPAGCCMASSWDVGALNELGHTLGKTARMHDLSLLLGPGVNIKRSPLCGRNFEYFSEDPFLSGELGAAYIKGVQSEGVSACVKHFAGNNQETRRLTVNAVIDERALREIYLPAFERCVKNGADTVMAAYNTLNGDSCTQNKRLLLDILRDEWGFDGMVVSDWGAVTNDPAAAGAGCDLKMPGFPSDPGRIVAALADGSITEQALDKAVINVTAFLLKAENEKNTHTDWGKGQEDMDKNHALARKLASQSIVLLKNDGALPVKKRQKLLLAGSFAKNPHFQGGGSSRANVYKIDGALEFFECGGYDVTYIPDFDDIKAMVNAAKACDIALVFAGTPEAEDSEGFDRAHMLLPPNQNAAISALCEVVSTAVILFDGSAVVMPWADKASAIIEAFLPGEAGGSAVFDVLTGRVNPSGKLTETFPQRVEDCPAYIHFPGVKDTSIYGESIFVGYRYYEKKQITPLFPFGHGLSYTTFEYSGLGTGKDEYSDDETVTVTLNVKNTGAVAGKEIVQLYVQPVDAQMIRPVKELKGFCKVSLAPGETKEITFLLDSRAFAWYDEAIHDWRVDTGEYKILACASSRDVRCEKAIMVNSTRVEKKVYTRDTLMSEAWETSYGRAFLEDVLEQVGTKGKKGDNEGDAEAYLKMVLAMPIKALILIGWPVPVVDGLIAELNGGSIVA